LDELKTVPSSTSTSCWYYLFALVALIQDIYVVYVQSNCGRGNHNLTKDLCATKVYTAVLAILLHISTLLKLNFKNTCYSPYLKRNVIEHERQVQY